jgi:ubiquinone/menaquinone biosynthesis C-methylase UbiE
MMDSNERKTHWENIYNTKELKDVSWYQPTPQTSLDFLKEFNVGRDAAIIDVGGGDSLLVDHLLEMGYTDIAVLDISEQALNRARQRLGEKAKKVHWIVSDAAEFKPEKKYDFWHDRAAFHFLTNEVEINKYIDTIRNHLSSNGILIMGTFSEEGPKKCSGIEIKQYSEKTLSDKLSAFFKKIKCIKVDHKTPFETIQNFLFCSFRLI